MQENVPRAWFTPRLVVGLSLVTIGALLQLDVLGFVEAERLLRLWPVILIGVGVAKLASHAPGQSVVAAWAWIIGGGLILARKLHVLDADLIGPVFLMLIGAAIVFRAIRDPRREEAVPNESGFDLRRD